jgi:formylglycine-generating enzyme required for sulfatase activity
VTLLLLVVAALSLSGGREAARDLVEHIRGPRLDLVAIDGGVFQPLYPANPDEKEVRVDAFRMDRFPVTNGDFLRFVRREPRWQRTRVSRLFADLEYLSHWAGPRELGEAAGAEEPVTRVSWFAAKAYCEWREARLPTELEWEYVAAADERTRDARKSERFTRRLLDWYGERTPRPGCIGLDKPNVWGLHDLHGLTWEWVLDFNSNLVSPDSRDRLAADKQRFCGDGALSATQVRDYAGFMRFAFRSSLLARYTTKNLGFRCAVDREGST